MLALAMRQAQRNGGKITVIDPRPVSLPIGFRHLPVQLDEAELCFGAIIREALAVEDAEGLGQSGLKFYEALPDSDSIASTVQDQIADVARELRASQRPIIVCGTEIVRQANPALAADCVQLLLAANKQAGLFYLMPGANSYGASLLESEGVSFSEILEGIESGTVKALILVESNLFWLFHDRQRLDLAIEKLDFLIVFDCVNSPAVQKAHVFLPTSTLYEAGGVFINQEGRAQFAPRAYRGGTPLVQVSGGDHPPRIYGSEIPGGEVRAGWHALNQIADGDPVEDEDATRRNLLGWLADNLPALAEMPPFDELTDDGMRISSSHDGPSQFSVNWQEEKNKGEDANESLEVILTDWTFGTEELSSFSPPLRKLERRPCASMHTDDAARLGLSHGDKVRIKLDEGDVEVDVWVEEHMAPGVLVLPRHRLLEWQKIKRLPKFVRFEEIEKTAV